MHAGCHDFWQRLAQLPKDGRRVFDDRFPAPANVEQSRGHAMGHACDPAALKADTKQKTHYPADPGRNRPKTIDWQRNMAVRTLLRTPWG